MDLEVLRSYWMNLDELREQDEITEYNKRGDVKNGNE